MEYQKPINLLGNIPNQTSRFGTITWIEVNDDARGRNNTNSQIKFKTSVLKSILCDYNDAYICLKDTIKVPNTEAAAAAANNRDKKVIFKISCHFKTK